jgi:hypothetical protein
VISDVRGWRIALTPDALINTPQNLRGTLPDVLGVLQTSGYGVLQLPPPGEHRLLLAAIADQVEEYSHHGYAVVAIGVRAVVAIGVRAVPDNGLHWRRLTQLLRHRGVALPPRHIIRPDIDAVTEGQRLSTWLSSYDLPEAEQRRWR